MEYPSLVSIIPLLSPVLTGIIVLIAGYWFNRRLEARKIELQTTLQYELEALKSTIGRNNIQYSEYVKRQFLKLEELYEAMFAYMLFLNEEYRPPAIRLINIDDMEQASQLAERRAEPTKYVIKIIEKFHAAAFYTSKETKLLVNEYIEAARLYWCSISDVVDIEQEQLEIIRSRGDLAAIKEKLARSYAEKTELQYALRQKLKLMASQLKADLALPESQHIV